MNGVSSQMGTFNFFFGLILAEKIFSHTDNLSRTLQKTSMSASQGQAVTRQVVQVLQKIRSNEAFHLFWTNSIGMAKNANVSEPVLPRKKKAPSRFEIGSGSSHYYEDPESHFRQIYFEVLDRSISCIQNRFQQPGNLVINNIENLLLHACNDEDLTEECIVAVRAVYEEDLDFDILPTQLQVLSSMVPSNAATVSDLLHFLQQLSKPERSLLSEVYVLCKLLLVLPATNAVSERSFSAMRRVKTYLRNTTGQERLNHLMMLHVHCEKTDSLDLTKVANEFVSYRDRRFSFFGKF